jgi:hypothetical protein
MSAKFDLHELARGLLNELGPRAGRHGQHDVERPRVEPDSSKTHVDAKSMTPRGLALMPVRLFGSLMYGTHQHYIT